MILGLLLMLLGLVLVLFPRPLIVLASRYRIWMPDGATPRALRSARIGALGVMAVGLFLLLALS